MRHAKVLEFVHRHNSKQYKLDNASVKFFLWFGVIIAGLTVLTILGGSQYR